MKKPKLIISDPIVAPSQSMPTEEKPQVELTDKQKEEYADFVKLYGTIETITGKDKDGNTLACFLKEIPYDVEKAVMLMLMNENPNIIDAGELILTACFVGGDDLYANRKTRLKASLEAFHLFQVDDSVAYVKKN